MKSLRTLALIAVCHGLCACELVADFDRGRLDAGASPDAGRKRPPETIEDVDAGAEDADGGKK
jgi:hypothetical protein